MRYLFVVLFALSIFSAFAQHEAIPATENFSIEGKVKKGLVVSIGDLSAYKFILLIASLSPITWGKKKQPKKSKSDFIERRM